MMTLHRLWQKFKQIGEFNDSSFLWVDYVHKHMYTHSVTNQRNTMDRLKKEPGRGDTINIYLPKGDKDALIAKAALYEFDSVAQYVRYMCIEKAEIMLNELK